MCAPRNIPAVSVMALVGKQKQHSGPFVDMLLAEFFA
jgi:hypothetical protein